jgi:putative colanic acid biosynthesis UDP-glucose lipid carrier transferase
MLRHKVKPGITGWRRSTACVAKPKTLDKMRARIQYDIDTMRTGRSGSISSIIAKTVAVVWRDQNAC